MLQAIIAIAAAIYIGRAIQQWRLNRRVRRSLEPGAGLTHGIKRAFPRWFVFGSAFAISFVAIAITGLFIQEHEKREQKALAAEAHSKCVDAHMDKSKPFDPDAYLVALEQC